jgi:hypothetical protein
MSKHDLTLSPDYVSDWTYLQAVRELFQNALDNQTIDPTNEMFFKYTNKNRNITDVKSLRKYLNEVNSLEGQLEVDTETVGLKSPASIQTLDFGTLIICNKTSVLQVESLLMGSSSKRNNKDTIGKHGEGYKVALLILLREGKEVTIYNYGKRQIWTTRNKKSRKYNGAIIPEVTINSKATWKTKPKYDLTIEIKGITPEEYMNIVNSNLHLQEKQACLQTSNNMGYVLTDPKFKGKMYVNGLFIAENKQFKYGYSIHPSFIDLDRDRRMVDTVNLAWVTSQLWRYVGQEKLVAKLLLDDVWDVKYVKERRDYNHATQENEIDDKIKTNLRSEFVTEHGDKAIPVSDNKELQRVSKASSSYKPTMVSTAVTAYISGDSALPSVPHISTKARLQTWFKATQSKLSDEEKDEFQAILSDLAE